jgi:hypothetical protein
MVLWKNAQWLDRQIHNQRVKSTNIMRFRVYMVQTQNSLCKSILYGLKDEELELRIEKLERAIREGVVIPREKC